MGIESLRWIGHASFVLNAEEMNIYIDPFGLEKSYGNADIIFVTHPHFDHFSIEDIRKVATGKTVIFAPHEVAEKLHGFRVAMVEPGKEYAHGALHVSTVPAYNVVHERLKNHPKEKGWVGYRISTEDGSIYHAGDTDFIPEMNAIKADIALIPMGGTYVMDPDEAITAAESIDAGEIVPMHYKALLGREGSTSAEEKFRKRVSNCRIMEEIQTARYSF